MKNGKAVQTRKMILLVLVIVVGTLAWKAINEAGTNKHTGRFLPDIPEDIDRYAKEHYEIAINLLDDVLEESGGYVLEKGYCVYGYPVEKKSTALYHYPISHHGNIIAIYTVYSEDGAEASGDGIGEGNSEWLNSIDYLNQDYLLYSIDVNENADPEMDGGIPGILVAEDISGNQYFENEERKKQLRKQDKEFLALDTSEKLALFTKK